MKVVKEPSSSWIRPQEMPASGAETVSYTHLDVYKRQGFGLCMSFFISPGGQNH